jgi:hypothetical protein
MRLQGQAEHEELLALTGIELDIWGDILLAGSRNRVPLFCGAFL